MIESMTGFASSSEKSAIGQLTCELRAVNHRYLEISVTLPEMLRAFEMPVRDKIKKSFHRGKIECIIRFQRETQQASAMLLNLNVPLATSLLHMAGELKKITRSESNVMLNLADILRYPGVLESKEIDLQALNKPLLQAVQKAIAALTLARQREGDELKVGFSNRLAAIRVHVQKIKNELPAFVTLQTQKLKEKFDQLNLSLDPHRLEQEIILFSQKIDIAEEIERTETHLTEVDRLLHDGGLIGRRLDFLLQELHREANTLGAKSQAAGIVLSTIDMKVLIEQFREQVQNIE